jgi:hypothetical protein
MKFIAFGDSFVNIFLSLKSENFKVVKFKGATMKGLINHNENYNTILNKLKDNEYDYGFFTFGQVDFLFYYYYKKYIVKEEVNINSFAEKYVLLIKSLPNIKNKYILNVQPNTINDENYPKIIKYYTDYTEKDISEIPLDEFILKNRHERIINFNNLLDKYCKINNINFINTFDKLTNNKLELYNEFKMQKNNIHFNFEYVLLVYIAHCIPFMKKYYNYNKLIKKMEVDYNKYLKKSMDINQYVKDNEKKKLELYNNLKFNLKKIKKYL